MRSFVLFVPILFGCIVMNSTLAGDTETLPLDDFEISFDPTLAPPGAGPMVIKHDQEETPPANPKLIVERDGSKAVEIYGAKRPLSQIGIDVDGDHIVEIVQDRMDKAGMSDTINVYIKIGVPVTDEVVDKIKSVVGKSVAVHPITDYGLNHVAVALTAPQLVLVAKLPFVQLIEPAWAGYQKIAMNQAREYTGTNYAHSLGSLCSGWLNDPACAINGDHDGSRWTFSSNDVVVAVMDTGIDRTHEAFNGGTKIIGWTDQTGEGAAQPVDPQGHGTHVASIIAGDSSVGYHGVVPAAALVGVRVFDSNGFAPTLPDGESSVTKGLRWILANRAAFNIRVVNFSGGTSGCYPSTGYLEQTLVNQIIDAGVTFVTIAGNSEGNSGVPRYCQINLYGAVPRAIAVGNIADPATSEAGLGWTLQFSSGWGPTADGVIKPDVVAPGTCIMAARAAGTNLNIGSCSFLPPANYVSSTGTSMSAPFVAGIAAGLLDANWNLSPASVKSYIVDNAETASGGNNNIYGKGYVRAFNTYKAALGASQTWDDGFDHTQSSMGIGQGTELTYSFTRSNTSKHIHVTLVAPKYGFNSGGEGNVAFRVQLITPSGTIHSQTDTASTPIKHLSRDPGGVTGTWKVKVKAISVPNGGYASYLLDVTEK
jgi:serine protease AprX